MLIDLSHIIEDGMQWFPGDPEPSVESVSTSAPWLVSRLSLGSHTGTHVDAASHFLPGGATIDAYPLERFVLDACVARVRRGADEAIGADDLAPALSRVPKGGALLLATGWDRHWTTELYERHPYLSEDACERLVRAGVGLVGTDALNVDATHAPTTHAHRTLMSADILIVENLTSLDRLDPDRVYRAFFAPLRIGGCDGSPIRAFADDGA